MDGGDDEKRGCIGSISEIFEADEPHRSVGCAAQAWSVAEVLRLAGQLDVTRGTGNLPVMRVPTHIGRRSSS